MECSLCHAQYNDSDKLPKILSSCGHTFCSECLGKLAKGGSIQCSVCSRTTSFGSVGSLPTNHALLSLPKSDSSTGQIMCQTHGKSLEAFCPETLALLCVDCLLSKAYKGKHVKSIDEAYKDAIETLPREIKSCEEFNSKAQEALVCLEANRYILEDSCTKEIVKAESFYLEVARIASELQQKAEWKVKNEISRKEEDIEETMRELKSKMYEASEISQDKYLSKIEFLRRVKNRRESVNSVKKCLTSLPSKLQVDPFEFMVKNELDVYIGEIRAFFEDYSRPSLASSKSKQSAPSTGYGSNKNNKIPPPSTKPTSKADKQEPAKRPTTAAPALAQPQNKSKPSPTPSQPQIPSLADRRNEIKMMKPGNPSVVKTPTHAPSNGLLSNASTVPKPPTQRPLSPRPANKNNPMRGSKDYHSGDHKGLMIQGHSTTPHSNDTHKQGHNAGVHDTGRDISKMTINVLEDQKISILSETHRVTRWDQRRGDAADGLTFNPQDFEGVNLLERLNKATEEESVFALSEDTHAGAHKILMSDSKDQTYYLDKYLETLNYAPTATEDKQHPVNGGGQTLDAWKRPTTGGSGDMLQNESKVKEHPRIYTSVFKDSMNDPPVKEITGVPDRLLCIGGKTDDGKMQAEVYDPKKNCWSTVEKVQDSRQGFGMVPLSRNAVLIVGGLLASTNSALQSSISFSTVTNSFSSHPLRLIKPKSFFAHVIVGSRLFVFGGLDSSGNHSIADCEEHDLVTGESTIVPPLRIKRSEAAAVVLKNQIYVIGGKDERGNSLKSIERFDINRRVWDEIPEMLIARRGMVAEVIKDNIYVIGGFDGEKFLCSVEKYLLTNLDTSIRVRCGVKCAS